MSIAVFPGAKANKCYTKINYDKITKTHTCNVSPVECPFEIRFWPEGLRLRLLARDGGDKVVKLFVFVALLPVLELFSLRLTGGDLLTSESRKLHKLIEN